MTKEQFIKKINKLFERMGEGGIWTISTSLEPHQTQEGLDSIYDKVFELLNDKKILEENERLLRKIIIDSLRKKDSWD